MDKIDELVKRTAEARRTMQMAADVELTARMARSVAEQAYQDVYGELREEIHKQVDALTPERDGDRVVG